MHCPQCQSPVDPGDGFCRRCGAAQAAAAPRPAAAPIDRRGVRDPGPPPRQPPSLLMSDHDAMITFGLLFGGIFSLVGTLVGVVFTVIGLTGEAVFGVIGPLAWLVFGGIGYTVLGLAVRKVLRLRRLWRDGQVVEGRVTQIARDHSIRVNGRSPLLVSYSYRDITASGEGATHSWNMSLLDLGPDARLSVLISAEQPGRSLAVLPSEAIAERPRAAPRAPWPPA